MLEILPIMPALCSMLINAHYAQNYTGIIGASLPTSHNLCTASYLCDTDIPSSSNLSLIAERAIPASNNVTARFLISTYNLGILKMLMGQTSFNKVLTCLLQKAKQLFALVCRRSVLSLFFHRAGPYSSLAV